MAPPSPSDTLKPRGCRRWIKRTAYLLAAGGLLGGALVWSLRQPFTERLLIGQLDALARRELGLGLTARGLRMDPLRGRVVLKDFALGGDLLSGETLEVTADLGSLLGSRPRIYGILLEGITATVDRERLARIHLRQHPPSTREPKVLLDQFLLRRGSLRLPEPLLGLPAGRVTFWARGTGAGPNGLDLELGLPQVTAGEGPRRLEGHGGLRAHLEEALVQVGAATLTLGSSRTTFSGRFEPAARRVEALAEGTLDLAEAARFAGAPPKGLPAGTVDFSAHASGPMANPAWEGTLRGRGLRVEGTPLRPGSLQVQAAGTARAIQVRSLAWESLDGKVTATGGWDASRGTRLEVEATGVSLGPAAVLARADFLKGLTARFQGSLTLPGAPWTPPPLDRITFRGTGSLRSPTGDAGAFEADLADGSIRLTDLELRLPDLAFKGSGRARCTRRGLAGLEAAGDLRTDAETVALALRAWNVVSLDMAGETHAQAQVSWSPARGLALTGKVDVEAPRYHGALADHLQAQVSIQDSQLDLRDIQLEKGEGRGYGELWLTWKDLPPDSPQIDMCYRAWRLPVREGLGAADLADLSIDGTGSGWVRLHGPYQHILMEGAATAQEGRVYGIRLPAVAGDFSMDLETLRMKVQDLRVTGDPLRPGAEDPGFLALKGDLDMDLLGGTWKADLGGSVDTTLLDLPGPRFQALMEAHLDGPLTVPMGPWQAPAGTLSFSSGRLFVEQQSLEGLEGGLRFQDGLLGAWVGLQGKERHLLELAARQKESRLEGDLSVAVEPRSADTAHLAGRLTGDFLKDLHLEARLDGSLGAGGLDWKGTVKQLTGRFQGFELLQSRPGSLQGDLSGARLALALEGRDTGDTGEPGPASARFQLAGALPFTQTGALGLHLDGSAELANLKTIADHLLEPGQYSLMSDMHPAGSATFDLNLGGTLAGPSLDGSLRLAGGRLQVRAYPQSIENVDFTLHFKGQEILIPETEPLRGTVALGALKAYGRATWQFKGISAYDLHASLEDFQLRDMPEGFELQGSVDLAIKGNDQDGGKVTGDLWAKRMLYRADINLTDLFLASAMGGSSALSALDPEDPLARVDLDLNLHLARPWEFDTNLLKLQGRPSGGFKVLGTLARQGLKGRMDFLAGGRLTNLLPAGDIVLERGSVEFPDPGTFNPILDFQGRIDVSPYLVSLSITGTLDALQLKPSSTPSLRQDEIVAILIDPSLAPGIGSASGTTSQSALNFGIASTGGGLLTSLALANFQEMVRKTFFLDRVNVAWRPGAAATSETTVTLGKSFDVFGHRTPVVFTHTKTGVLETTKGQMEWRFGNLVLQLGASQSSDGLGLSGEIRHTWSPR